MLELISRKFLHEIIKLPFFHAVISTFFQNGIFLDFDTMDDNAVKNLKESLKQPDESFNFKQGTNESDEEALSVENEKTNPNEIEFENSNKDLELFKKNEVDALKETLKELNTTLVKKSTVSTKPTLDFQTDDHQIERVEKSAMESFEIPDSDHDDFEFNEDTNDPIMDIQIKDSDSKENEKKPPKCEACDGGQLAINFCQECQENLCKICVNAHKRVKLTKNHSLKTIFFCDGCKEGITASHFCFDCNEHLCKECVGAHKRVKLTKNHVLNLVL